jgi:hypothetical protein
MRDLRVMRRFQSIRLSGMLEERLGSFKWCWNGTGLGEASGALTNQVGSGVRSGKISRIRHEMSDLSLTQPPPLLRQPGADAIKDKKTFKGDF